MNSEYLQIKDESVLDVIRSRDSRHRASPLHGEASSVS